eukprot:4893755-Prymnesium_polylepis.1
MGGGTSAARRAAGEGQWRWRVVLVGRLTTATMAAPPCAARAPRGGRGGARPEAAAAPALRRRRRAKRGAPTAPACSWRRGPRAAAGRGAWRA